MVPEHAVKEARLQLDNELKGDFCPSLAEGENEDKENREDIERTSIRGRSHAIDGPPEW